MSGIYWRTATAALAVLYCSNASAQAVSDGPENFVYLEVGGLAEGFSFNYEREVISRLSLRLGHGGGINLGHNPSSAYPENMQTMATAKYAFFGYGESIRAEAEFGLIAYKRTFFVDGDPGIMTTSETTFLPGGGIGLRFGKGNGFLWGLEWAIRANHIRAGERDADDPAVVNAIGVKVGFGF